MIFKRLIPRLRQNEHAVRPQIDSDKSDQEFVALVRSLEAIFGKEIAENILLNFHHGESSLAIECLINNIVEVEPPLTEEQQERIALLAETEDRWNERRWQEHNAGMTGEQMKKYKVKDFRTHLLAEFREVYPKQKSKIVIDMNPQDPGMDRKGARDFFYSYFYAEFLKNEHSVEEAVQEYLDEGSDPQGRLLLSEASALVQANMSEEELIHLIEEVWRSQGNARGVGFAYKKVLNRIIDYLEKQ
ncbi:MAG TPA: hypothetical protein VF733_00055 [Candidatus Saccharimonadales bacterium]